MFRKQLVIHAWFVVETVEISGGNQLDQILVALLVFAEQDEVIGTLGARAAIFVIIWRHIHFAADDGLNTVGSGLMIEIRGGEEISVVGYGDGGHSAARGFGGKFADFASAVQKRVIRVQMKVNKVRGIHAKFILNQLAAARNTNLRLYFFPQGCGSAPVKSRSLSASGARQTAVGRKKARDSVRDDRWFPFFGGA